MSNEIYSEVIDVHGYLTLATYIHYFLPGSLKIHTKLRTVKLGQIGSLLKSPETDVEIFGQTRRTYGGRWLPKNEIPYPGYCRAPGSTQCLPVFCNCAALERQWVQYLSKKRGKTKPGIMIPGKNKPDKSST